MASLAAFLGPIALAIEVRETEMGQNVRTRKARVQMSVIDEEESDERSVRAWERGCGGYL
jgi:hypothetical protein